jgi:hypothetical protein
MSTNATVLPMNKIKIVSKSFNIGDLTIIITLSDCVGETIKGFLSSLRSSSFFSFTRGLSSSASGYEFGTCILIISIKYNLRRLYVHI